MSNLSGLEVRPVKEGVHQTDAWKDKVRAAAISSTWMGKRL